MSDSDQYHVRRSRRQQCVIAAAAAVVVAVVPGCAYEGLGMGPSGSILEGEGALAAPSPTAKAITYNPGMAPTGAQLSARMTPSGGDSTTVELTVSGMVPNRSYAAHAHTAACNVDPQSAGPHYQNEIDPAATTQAPSTNPAYANPQNEIWLDLRTDASGAGSARTTVPFQFAVRGPASVVIHQEERTATGPGQAGAAGTRLACLTLSAAGFKPAS